MSLCPPDQHCLCSCHEVLVRRKVPSEVERLTRELEDARLGCFDAAAALTAVSSVLFVEGISPSESVLDDLIVRLARLGTVAS